GITVGDQIALMTPTGRRNFTLRALLEPEGVARILGGNFLVMDLMAAEAVFTQPGFVNRVDVVLSPDAVASTVAAAIDGVLPAGFSVQLPAQQKADLGKVIQSLQFMLQGLALIALVAAFLIAYNRLATVFEARAWQLGIMRATGVPMKRVV